jgi:hypothetical protein
METPVERTKLRPDYRTVAVVAWSVFVDLPFLAFPFYFAPGWANGWPGGLTMARVWSAGMTLGLFAWLTAAGVGFGALIALAVGRFTTVRKVQDVAFVAWLLFWLSFAVVACALFYAATYAGTLKMWAGGYPAGS